MTSCEYLICLTSYLMMDIFFFFVFPTLLLWMVTEKAYLCIYAFPSV